MSKHSQQYQKNQQQKEMEMEENKVEAPVKKEVRRVYNEQMVITSDRYKLLGAMYRRDMSRNSKIPDFENFDHTHFFHTFDSNGKKQQFCEAALGHKHEVIYWEEDGELKAKCGRIIGVKPGGEHTHETVYQKSSTSKVREVNIEAMKFLAKKEVVAPEGLKI